VNGLCTGLCVLIVALVVAGCGGEAPKETPKPKSGEAPKTGTPAPAKATTPEAAVRKLWDLAKAGDKAAVTACFCQADQAPMAEDLKIIAEMQKVSPGAGFSLDVAQTFIADAQASGAIDYRNESIEGDKATCEIHYTREGSTRESKKKLSLVREGDEWKIDYPVPDPAENRKKLEALKKALQ